HLTYLIDLDQLARKQVESTPLQARGNLLTARVRHRLVSAFPDLAACLAIAIADAGALDEAAVLRVTGASRKTLGEAPQGALEELVAGCFAEVLERERVDRDTDFFEEGGNSLQVARLTGRLQEKSGHEVSLRQVFETPTVRKLATALEGCARSAPVPLTPVDRSRPIPLSWQQESLWFLDKL
ncbi:phosphopantetheine-binding protein, partial [Roseibium sp. RKSG952]|uniref:phosphopantetheine-binding protein n=1 Tax=Roseibium sp. RKSG952 TaxID=2529384 RepID=UPI0012BC57A0